MKRYTIQYTLDGQNFLYQAVFYTDSKENAKRLFFEVIHCDAESILIVSTKESKV